MAKTAKAAKAAKNTGGSYTTIFPIQRLVL
jgi:hypothetical protein